MALSTSNILTLAKISSVIYPVTPNGVEHTSLRGMLVIGTKVIYPVTPNGVEHLITEILSNLRHCDLSGNA